MLPKESNGTVHFCGYFVKDDLESGKGGERKVGSEEGRGGFAISKGGWEREGGNEGMTEERREEGRERPDDTQGS